MLVANIFPFLIFRGLVGGGSDSIIFWNALVPFLIHIKVCSPLTHQRSGKEDTQKVVLGLTFTHIFLRGIHGKIKYRLYLLVVCLFVRRSHSKLNQHYTF